MYYSVMQLNVIAGQAPAAMKRLEPALAKSAFRSEFLGCFYSEIGALNRLILLRGADDFDDISADHKAIVEADDPLGVSDLVTSRVVDVFRPFPGTPCMKAGKYGPIFEFRTYSLRPNGLPPTFAAWDKVLTERMKLSPLVAVMYAVTGNTPRFMHIWPYRDILERMNVRARAVEVGVWPPPGGIDHIQSMQSEIFLPAAFSPIS